MGAIDPPMTSRTRALEYQALVGLLRQLRIEKGVLQADLARALGEPQPYVSKYERSERRLSLIDVLRILRALGESPDEFLAALEREFPPHSDARRGPSRVKPGKSTAPPRRRRSTKK